MSNHASLAAAAVAEAVARRKLAEEQGARYQALTRRGEELTDAVRAVRFHEPDTLPEHAHLCDMKPGKLAAHVDLWVDKLMDAGRRIAEADVNDSLGGDGGTHNPFMLVALALYRAATEGDRQRVARELGDVCGRLLVRDHDAEWPKFKDALGAVAEWVCAAWNVRRDGLLREQCPDIPRPYIETQQTEGEEAPADTDADRPPRHAKRPSKDRQNEILAAIRTARMPLTRPELVDAMRLKTEGALGHDLAWMTGNGILVNISQRGYWPRGEPVPE